MKPRPRILLADDHTLLLAAFQQLLAPTCDVVGAVSDGRGLLEAAQRVGIQHRARAPASCRETAPAARRPRTGPAGSRLPLVVNHGGRKLGERFEIRADQSKVIRRLQETLMAMSDESIAPVI
jgi:CheY-like chemotaxis protein